MKTLPDGLIAVVKRDCQTCELVAPVLGALEGGGTPLTVYTQDDPTFPDTVKTRVDDSALETSYALEIEIVPTLIRVEGGREAARVFGWNRDEWRAFTGDAGLGADLPENRPGCGSLTHEPGMAETLAVRFGKASFASRRIAVGKAEDPVEACHARGWTDGLPVVPPTPERVWRMLQGTKRAPDEVIGQMPPNLDDCTVEKVAVNAVMAGCLPEYLPVVLAAVEAALEEPFCLHGLLATTQFVGPMVIVNGPARRRIGMNWRGNALGQGNRANSSIGRALQLVVRNVGGGRPQEVDRATLGNPGKVGWCTAENEEESPWEPLAQEHGVPEGRSAVTVLAGGGVIPVIDQGSRSADSLAQSFATHLRIVHSPKRTGAPDALVVVSPEHGAIFREHGWSKARFKQRLHDLTTIDGDLLLPGALGIEDGMKPAQVAGKKVPKFRDGGISVIHCGGQAGLFSCIVPGWDASGPRGSSPVTREIAE